MYFDDHDPPHFHALYGGDEALVGIDSLAVLHGRLPPRAQGLVVEWASLRRAELREAWDLAKRLELARQNRSTGVIQGGGYHSRQGVPHGPADFTDDGYRPIHGRTNEQR